MVTSDPAPGDNSEKPAGIADGVAWIVTSSFTAGWAISLGVLLLTPVASCVRWLVALAWLPIFAGLAWLSHRWPGIEQRYVSYTVDDLAAVALAAILIALAIVGAERTVTHLRYACASGASWFRSGWIRRSAREVVEAKRPLANLYTYAAASS